MKLILAVSVAFNAFYFIKTDSLSHRNVYISQILDRAHNNVLTCTKITEEIYNKLYLANKDLDYVKNSYHRLRRNSGYGVKRQHKSLVELKAQLRRRNEKYGIFKKEESKLVRAGPMGGEEQTYFYRWWDDSKNRFGDERQR